MLGLKVRLLSTIISIKLTWQDRMKDGEEEITEESAPNRLRVLVPGTGYDRGGRNRIHRLRCGKVTLTLVAVRVVVRHAPYRLVCGGVVQEVVRALHGGTRLARVLRRGHRHVCADGVDGPELVPPAPVLRHTVVVGRGVSRALGFGPFLVLPES